MERGPEKQAQCDDVLESVGIAITKRGVTLGKNRIQ